MIRLACLMLVSGACAAATVSAPAIVQVAQSVPLETPLGVGAADAAHVWVEMIDLA